MDIVPTTYFSEVGGGGIPLGYNVYVGEEVRTNPTTYGSQACMKTYSEGGDFTRALYFRQDYVTFGEQEEYPLTLEEGKNYTFRFNTMRWKASGQYMKFELIAPNEDVVFTKIIENNPDINGAQNVVVSGSTVFEESIVAQAAGNYIMKWSCLSNADGDAGGFNEMMLANVSVKYVPNVMGIVEIQTLDAAISKAKEVLLADSAKRYAGEDYSALDALVKDVEANKANYSAPSVYTAKTEALNAGVKALNDHVDACDTYDKAIKETIDLVAKFKDTKFAPTEYYQNVVKTAEKYHASKELKITPKENAEEGNDTTEVYNFDVLKANDALATATKEVADANLLASKWLTEGASGKGWGWITTGYAALHERIRRGVALLESLGVAKDDALIVKANAELGDNDEIADEIVARAQEIILTDLAKGEESKLFEAPFDEETEDYGDAPTYDLSVFFKNPNCYGPANSTEVPGWTSVQGNGFAWSSWNGAENHSASTPYPEDCDIHAGWHPNPYAMVEQTVTNLPAGVYVVSVKCNDNGGSWDEEKGGTCAFLRTSDCPEIEEGVAVDRTQDFAIYVTASGDMTVKDEEGNDTGEGITVTDGQLGVGFYYSNESQAFFEEITAVKLVAPAEGYDYKAALTSIETSSAAAKVRSLQIFDLNGRRIIKAHKGLQIVKKQMSDGTVRVEKVIVK